MVPFPDMDIKQREIGVVSVFSIGLSRQNMPATGAIRFWLSFKEGPLFIGDTDIPTPPLYPYDPPKCVVSLTTEIPM